MSKRKQRFCICRIKAAISDLNALNVNCVQIHTRICFISGYILQLVGPRDGQPPGWVSGLTEDFALIARAAEPQTGQMMLVIAGLSEKGSAAALEFVTNPKYLDRFAATASPGWERRNIELVIKSDLLNDDWGEPRVVAANIW